MIAKVWRQRRWRDTKRPLLPLLLDRMIEKWSFVASAAFPDGIQIPASEMRKINPLSP